MTLTERLQAHFDDLKPLRIGVAISGGSDSTALLYAARAWDVPEIEAATVDHGLRPEASAEAKQVADLCKSLGVRHQTLTWRGWDGQGNLQHQARDARYQLLAQWARERELSSVVLGHTMDDQAETFLMRLSRMAGVDGLSTMRGDFHRHSQRFDRPFLDCQRNELRTYLSSHGVSWAEDPSNDDTTFDRVKMRQALAVLAPLGIGPKELFTVSRNLRSASNALSQTMRAFVALYARLDGGDVVIDRETLLDQHSEIIRRFLASAFMYVGSETYAPRREALERVKDNISQMSPSTLHGCRVLFDGASLRISREFAAVENTRCSTHETWDTRWRLEGPNAENLEIRVLGDAVSHCADWRETGVPRNSLRASPAVWSGQELIAAPVAGLKNGWQIVAPTQNDFLQSAFLH